MSNASRAQARAAICGVYPILDADWMARTGLPPGALAAHLAALPIQTVQLRAKGGGGAAFAFAETWIAALRAARPDLLIVMNDRADVALALGADGIHVGQEDLPVAACREILGDDAVIGLSTHDPAEVAAAWGAGADYIGYGAVYGTSSKADAVSARGVEALAAAARSSRLPLVAIGGMTIDRLPEVKRTGAAGAAMISALWTKDAARSLKEAVAAWEGRT